MHFLISASVIEEFKNSSSSLISISAKFSSFSRCSFEVLRSLKKVYKDSKSIFWSRLSLSRLFIIFQKPLGEFF